MDRVKMLLPPLLGMGYAGFLIARAAFAYHNPLNQTDINTAIQLGVSITAGFYAILMMQPPGGK